MDFFSIRLCSIRIVGLCYLFCFSGEESLLHAETEGAREYRHFELAKKAVVKISAVSFRYPYTSPWNSPTLRNKTGTGFIIEGNQILTNAHVVSGLSSVRVQRPDQRKDYEAKVIYIGHDCDLALLKVENSDFFRFSKPLAIGSLPRLNSPVEVIGFPIGGKRMSITRGIVSRIDMDIYSHSQIDYHLTVQVDAAVNPGNSGGPVMQKGKVIGVAFQILSRGENLGYLIPPEVIQHFLIDASDGTYNGYTEFGISHTSTSYPAIRKALGLEGIFKSPDTGILIHGIIPGSSADGYLRKGDVLLELNGKKITETGEITLNGNLAEYSQLVDNLHAGDMIEVEIWRKRKKKKLSFPAKITKIFLLRRINYDYPASYYITGGFLFQPLDANLMKTYSSKWFKMRRSAILYHYKYFFSHEFYKKEKEGVILTRRLADKINLYSNKFRHRRVYKVNGKKINGFPHFVQIVQKTIRTKPYLVIEFFFEPDKLILKTSSLKEANLRIQAKHGLPSKAFYMSPLYQELYWKKTQKESKNKPSKSSKSSKSNKLNKPKDPKKP